MELIKNQIVDQLQAVVTTLDSIIVNAQKFGCGSSPVEKIIDLRKVIDDYQSVLSIGSDEAKNNVSALAVITKELGKLQQEVQKTIVFSVGSGLSLNELRGGTAKSVTSRPGVITTRFNHEKQLRRDWHKEVVIPLQNVSKTMASLVSTTHHMAKDLREKAVAKPVRGLSGR